MHILIVCQYYDPEPFRISDIAQELSKRNHSVDVLTGIPNYPEGKYYKGYGLRKRREERRSGVRIIRVPVVPRKRGRAVDLLFNYLSFTLSASLKALAFCRPSYDVILVYQLSPILMAIPGLIAASKLGVPFILYIADLWPESLATTGGTQNKYIYNAFSKIASYIYNKTELIFITSQGFSKSVQSRLSMHQNIMYIPQYPEEIYKPATVLDDAPERQEIPFGFNIVFTGNLGVSQGLEIVLDVAEKLSTYEHIHWILIGDGRARSNLESEAQARGLEKKVIFLGRRPMNRIPTYLALCDAALLCLRSEPLFSLTLPAKLQSYLACGIPVIGSIDGEASRIICEAQAGLVGPAGDRGALLANVLKMYCDTKEERSIYSMNALAYNEQKFCKKQLITTIESSLLEVASKPTKSTT